MTEKEIFGEDISDEWLEWFKLTPAERLRETSKLWQFYLAMGGSLDPEPDPQSPFHETYLAYGVYDYSKRRVRTISRSGI